MPLGTLHLFYGAVEFAANEVLLARKEIFGKPSHDLEMIVKVAFARLYLVDWLKFDSVRNEDNIRSTVAHWKQVFEKPLWKEAIIAAHNEDYAAMKKSLINLFPN